METLSAEYIIYYSTCLVLIVTSLICSVIRFMHICRPYDLNSDIFYPGRKIGSVLNVLVVLQLPYLLNITSPHTWNYIRIYGILFYSMSYLILVLRFFKNTNLYRKRKCFLALFIPSSIIILVYLFNCIKKDSFGISTNKTIFVIAVLLGVLQMLILLLITIYLKKRLNIYLQNHYSNLEDYPYSLSSNILYVPFICSLAMWVIFISDSASVKSAVDILLCLLQLWMLIVVLHPHLDLNFEDKVYFDRKQRDFIRDLLDIQDIRWVPEGIADSETKEEQSEDKKDSLVRDAVEIIRQKELFRDPNLKIEDIVKMLNTNRTYLYNAFSNSEYGTFYYLVNKMRVEYCQKLMTDNPGMDQHELFVKSGFSSLSTYYRVFKKITGFSPKSWIQMSNK